MRAQHLCIFSQTKKRASPNTSIQRPPHCIFNDKRTILTTIFFVIKLVFLIAYMPMGAPPINGTKIEFRGFYQHHRPQLLKLNKPRRIRDARILRAATQRDSFLVFPGCIIILNQLYGNKLSKYVTYNGWKTPDSLQKITKLALHQPYTCDYGSNGKDVCWLAPTPPS